MTEYQRIVDIPNVKQDAIYEKSRQWVAKNFQSANAVIQYQDKETGSIIGKGNAKIPCSSGIICLDGSSQHLEFTFQVDSKDNRARISFSDIGISHKSANAGIGTFSFKPSKESEKVQAKKTLDDIVDRLSKDIVSTSSSTEW